MHIEIAYLACGTPQLLELSQPRLRRTRQRTLCRRASSTSTQNSFKRRLHAARSGAHPVHCFDLRLLEACGHLFIQSVGHRMEVAERIILRNILRRCYTLAR
jgi:hypothetical protein